MQLYEENIELIPIQENIRNFRRQQSDSDNSYMDRIVRAAETQTKIKERAWKHRQRERKLFYIFAAIFLVAAVVTGVPAVKSQRQAEQTQQEQMKINQENFSSAYNSFMNNIDKESKAIDEEVQRRESQFGLNSGNSTNAQADISQSAAQDNSGNVSGSSSAIARTNLNIRSGPGTENEIVKTVSAGTTLSLLGEEENGWTKVAAPDGTEGWVSSDYLD